MCFGLSESGKADVNALVRSAKFEFGSPVFGEKIKLTRMRRNQSISGVVRFQSVRAFIGLGGAGTETLNIPDVYTWIRHFLTSLMHQLIVSWVTGPSQ